MKNSRKLVANYFNPVSGDVLIPIPEYCIQFDSRMLDLGMWALMNCNIFIL